MKMKFLDEIIYKYLLFIFALLTIYIIYSIINIFISRYNGDDINFLQDVLFPIIVSLIWLIVTNVIINKN